MFVQIITYSSGTNIPLFRLAVKGPGPDRLAPGAGMWYLVGNSQREAVDVEIYGTLGPACADGETLEQMFRLGMTGVRLNLSHTDLRRAGPLLDVVRAAAEQRGVRPGLLMDMQGPELRVGHLAAPMALAQGDTVTLGGDGIPVPEMILPFLLPGQELLLDDGKLLLEVKARTGDGCAALVLRGGVLQSRKSIALPGADIRPPAMTAEDLENIRRAAEAGITGVMQPFVRGPEDLRTVRAALDGAGCGHVKLLAKIESLAGVETLPQLMAQADEIVIARGDLGNAAPLWQLPALQKRIAAACRAAGKSFMVVTQLLASMEHSPVPTRAEVSDIFNAVLDGASSLMVTGETAAGRYPAEVIRWLVNTVREAERYMGK